MFEDAGLAWIIPKDMKLLRMYTRLCSRRDCPHNQQGHPKTPQSLLYGACLGKHCPMWSWHIPQNAFSDVQTHAGQDHHNLFVVDILHEFELSVWKSVLTHLIRMLHAIPDGLSLIGNLDNRKYSYLISGWHYILLRFYTIPTFGTSTPSTS